MYDSYFINQECTYDQQFNLLTKSQCTHNGISKNNVIINSSSNDFDIHNSLSNSLHTETGGFWLDSFKDDSEIDWTNSNDLNNSDNEMKIKGIIKGPPKVDNDTAALWHFNENSGSAVYDATNNNNDGSFVQTPSWTTGRYKSALDFSSGDGVSVSHSNSLDITGNITIEAWIKARGTASYLCIVDKYYGSMTISHGYTLYLGVGKLRLSIYSGSNGAGDAYGNIDLRDNTWHYVAGVFNGTHICIYVDGKLDSANTWNYAPTSTTNNLGIGKRLSGWGGYLPFNGVIDEVRISNMTRSSKEIWEYYAKTFEFYGNLTTKPVRIPSNMNWDTLIVDRAMPNNSELNITILNASDNMPIPNINIYNKSGEFDISYIDPEKYPTIKLNATFEGDGTVSPTIFYWGVSWNRSSVWTDTFFGGIKINKMQDITIKDGDAQFNNNGYLISKSIKTHDGYYFANLIINRTVIGGNSLYFSVLDERTNTEITGYKNLNHNKINLKNINPIEYPKIKLKAIFNPTGTESAILHNWSLNFTKNNPPKVRDCTPYSQIVNRTKSVKIKINISDQEEMISHLNLKVKYRKPSEQIWETEFLSQPEYDFENDYWVCTFSPTAECELGCYSFFVKCNDTFQANDSEYFLDLIKVVNNAPIIWTVNISEQNTQMKRTEMVRVFINTSDIEIRSHQLNVFVRYKPLDSDGWHTFFISDLIFNNNQWEFQFQPAKNATLGWYLFEIIVNDTVCDITNEFMLEVLNNLPNTPQVLILPTIPTTLDDLTINIIKANDIETPLNQLEYWYRWYKDDEYMVFFDNITTIPHFYTQKLQKWRCEVFTYDGLNVSAPGLDSITIHNSQPIVMEQIGSLEIIEDSSLILNNKLPEIFYDADSDELTYYVSGQNKIDIKIYPINGTITFTPYANWFGSEHITVQAYDTSNDYVEIKLLIMVTPANDLPEIVQVGNQLITDYNEELFYILNQDEVLTLPIQVEDIDGDVARGLIKFILNIDERSNFYFRDIDSKLIFQPLNQDVGWHFITIGVTDNNETPLQYISINIRIQVRNVNDPPDVKIIDPPFGSKFRPTDNFSIECVVEDIDLLINDSGEQLSYLWITNNSKFPILGNEPKLTNLSFPPGFYNITVIVTDTFNETAFDSINIIVKEKEIESGITEKSTPFNYVIWLILIIIIVLLGIIAYVLIRKRSKEIDARLAALGLVDSELLEPIKTPSKYTALETYIPDQMLELQAQTTSLHSSPSAVVSTHPLGTADTMQPAAQLPPAQTSLPINQPIYDPDEDKLGISSKLLPGEKLEILEEFFLLGEVSEALFIKLKTKYEMEIRSGAGKSAPQLPPGITSDVQPGEVHLDEEIEHDISTTPELIRISDIESPPVEVEPELSSELPDKDNLIKNKQEYDNE
jgi:hypothetical protein